MLKNKLVLFLTILLSIFLVNLNAIAFHESPFGHTEHKTIDIEEGVKKKELQSLHCTQSVKKHKELISIKSDPKEKNQDETETPKEKEAEVYKEIWVINHYHVEDSEFTGSLNLAILKDMEIIRENTTIQEVLSYYCVQEVLEDGLKKFKIGKNSAITKLYNEIATNNGYASKNDTIGNGDIFEFGLIHLTVGRPLRVSEAKFLHDEKINRNKATEKKRIKDEEDKERIKKEKKDNKNWIANNKQGYVDRIKDKKEEFTKEIEKVQNLREQLVIDFNNFEDLFKNTEIRVEDTLNFASKDNEEIKNLLKELTKNQRQFLDSSIKDNIRTKFKKIRKIKSKNYKNYNDLVDLQDRVQNSKKKKDFLGYKRLTRKDVIGFKIELEILEKSSLNIDSDENAIVSLGKKISTSKTGIELNISSVMDDIEVKEEELKSEIPYVKYIIYLVIFLAVIGVIVYIYLQNKKINEIKDDADKKVGSLKSDIEGKFKDTSEQIKRAERRGDAQQQKTPTQEPEKPKTQEEIIASKYDDLLSDYRDSLDDFSKVAAFKQKWNGLALSRKERQDGTKTILINSTRAFEKAEIWCVNFSDKYFAFPGSSVKSSMAAYMNMDFEKASRDFKGVFSISSGSSYSTEPAVLRRGGAGFVVDRAGKLIFPN